MQLRRIDNLNDSIQFESPEPNVNGGDEEQIIWHLEKPTAVRARCVAPVGKKYSRLRQRLSFFK